MELASIGDSSKGEPMRRASKRVSSKFQACLPDCEKMIPQRIQTRKTPYIAWHTSCINVSCSTW